MTKGEKQSLNRKRLIIMVTLAVLIIVGLRFILWHFASGHGFGHDEGTTFMSYAGPVFPMTLLEATEALSIERTVDFDFSPYEPKKESYVDGDGDSHFYTSYDYETIVTDEYLVENTSDQVMNVKGVYPFVGHLGDVEEIIPVIYVDGNKRSTTIHAGPYPARSFQLDSWEGYQALLADGKYMAGAFDAFPVLSEKVIVYEFSDMTADVEVADAENPTLNMAFEMDYKETQVLTFGAYGATFDPDNNYAGRNFGLSRPGAVDAARLSYLIVLGEDISGYTWQAYKNGNCEEDEKLEGIEVTVKRDERVLGELLRDIMHQYEALFDDTEETRLVDHLSDEEVYGLAMELLSSLGLITDGAVNNNMLMLEDIFSGNKKNDRVLYLSYDMVIPAGQGVLVSAQVVKNGSHDFAGSKRRNLNVSGYDLMTKLGSNLSFTKQAASIQDHGLIDIVRQNYGFDLDNDVRTVMLDTNKPYYYLEVRSKED